MSSGTPGTLCGSTHSGVKARVARLRAAPLCVEGREAPGLCGPFTSAGNQPQAALLLGPPRPLHPPIPCLDVIRQLGQIPRSWWLRNHILQFLSLILTIREGSFVFIFFLFLPFPCFPSPLRSPHFFPHSNWKHDHLASLILPVLHNRGAPLCNPAVGSLPHLKASSPSRSES